VRVNDDLRVIVHRTPSSLLLCYVAHHDAAYAWAERRKIERHPVTGAAQLVELPERVEISSVPVTAAPPDAAKPLLFVGVGDDALLGYGVPLEWLDAVRRADEDSLFDVAEHLPQEAAEALLNLATGATPPVPAPTGPPPDFAASMSLETWASRPVLIPPTVDAEGFQHPDAQRRFRVLTNLEELERALDYPWEKWAVFLHPAQRRLVERTYSGPARISGSAGTGKTIVALHRAVALTRRHAQAQVLLTTFSKPLSNALKTRLKYLVGNKPDIGGRIAVHPITGVGYELFTAAFGQPNLAPPSLIDALLRQAAAEVQGYRFTPRFLAGEWREVVDAWQIKRWEDYRNLARLGRKTRIGGAQREILWSIFERVRDGLAERHLVTRADLFGRVAENIAAGGNRPFDFAVVDEAQDVGVAELRFLAALVGARPDGLFFAGDLGQRIFQQPFSWLSLGVDVRGRSHTLRINYRTSHQIRAQADRLLPSSIADVDGNAENRRGTVSVFNGPAPTIEILADSDEEAEAVGRWVTDRIAEGMEAHEIGIFVRSSAQLRRARTAAKQSGVPVVELSDKVETTPGRLSIGTMHLAKGLEFRAVAVMACDDEVLPLQERIEAVADDADLEDVYNTERHLLYVACTRARDCLLVTGVRPASEFLDDLNQKGVSGSRGNTGLLSASMPGLYPLIRPALGRLPPEAAHELTLRALELGLGGFLGGGSARKPDSPILAQRLWGLDFANPVGLAAGFDKDARVPDAMLGLGFGFVEVGTVTPRTQPGNPKPRMFRLERDQAVVNRMGFNSGGVDAVCDRLSRRIRAGIVGVNLGRNRDTEDATGDYTAGILRTARLADYIVINVSSPNTPGLRELQHRALLGSLLERLIEVRAEAGSRPPLLVKIAPDLTSGERRDIAQVALETGIDGLIVSNTTVERSSDLVSRNAHEAGGLSGRPLLAPSTALLAEMYRLTQGRLPLIGVGGIASAEDAYAKIRAGASLVQLYTALIFAGPELVGQIKSGLAGLLERDGFGSIAEAVGSAQGETPPRQLSSLAVP